VGDEVVALFIPGLGGPEHARRGIGAANAILRATGHGDATPWLPIGAAVHTGRAFVGAMGAEGQLTDFTALGDAVNATARLASMAGAGETLVSADAARAAGLDTTSLTPRVVELRGRTVPMTVYSVPAGVALPRQSAA
jgi:adenylate cyclase